MTLRRVALWAVFALVAALAVSCSERQPPRMPHSPSQYDALRQADPETFPNQSILMYNLGRVLDEQLDATSRQESLELVIRLGGNDHTVRRQLAAALDLQCPDALREALLAYLMEKDAGELAPHIVATLPSLRSEPTLRQGVLEWLTRNPTPAALAQVVKLWAAQPVQGASEEQFRSVVQRQGEGNWRQVLMEAINTPNFFARGSAIEVLSRRLDAQSLRDLAMRMDARTDAMAALQAFVTHFDYLPSTGDEFLTQTVLHMAHGEALQRPAALAQAWRRADGYQFNVRDFHLLHFLATTPKHDAWTPRQELVEGLVTALRGRPVAPPRQAAAGADDLASVQQHLTLADLWNLTLLDEMLSRPGVQVALKVMSQRDRADTSTAWGGLITCVEDQASAKLYPAAAGGSDQHYLPGQQAMLDGRDALCRFIGHFEQADNASRAGPDAIELADAAVSNNYVLILTSTGESTFCAHYVNPAGVVVSLGVYPIGE